MTLISDERLKAVEPIVAIVGRTADGDWLVEDRNNNRYGLRNQLLEDYRFPETNGSIKPAPAPEPEPEPAPKPAPKKRASRKKKAA